MRRTTSTLVATLALATATAATAAIFPAGLGQLWAAGVGSGELNLDVGMVTFEGIDHVKLIIDPQQGDWFECELCTTVPMQDDVCVACADLPREEVDGGRVKVTSGEHDYGIVKARNYKLVLTAAEEMGALYAIGKGSAILMGQGTCKTSGLPPMILSDAATEVEVGGGE